MGIFRFLVFAGWSTLAVAAIPLDKHETINGVELRTGKEDSVRAYQGVVTKVFPHTLETVLKAVVNFNEKCNNSYKSKRLFTDQNTDCKYHNDNLVESVIIQDIKKVGWKKLPNEIDRFLIGRRVYNRGLFSHYDLVIMTETLNEKSQKVVSINQRMLSTKESEVYTDPKFEQESAFDETLATFTIVELSPKETSFTYEYLAETDHWILNKEVSVGQVFSSISKSINDLLKTVDAETAKEKRDVASN